MITKESESLDSVQMTSMKDHATEALAVLSHTNGSITQKNKKWSPKKFRVPIWDDLNQRIHAITKISKTKSLT